MLIMITKCSQCFYICILTCKYRSTHTYMDKYEPACNFVHASASTLACTYKYNCIFSIFLVSYLSVKKRKKKRRKDLLPFFIYYYYFVLSLTARRPVKLFKISIQGSEAVLALSSRSWLSYMYQGRFHLTPLSYETLEYASGFASEQCPEGIVAISVNTLRILALEKLGAVFNQEIRQLKYTPRKFAINLESNLLYLIETDHLSYTDQTKQERKQELAEQMIRDADTDEKKLAIEMANAFIQTKLSEQTFGAPKALPGMWASTIRIMDPLSKDVKGIIELEQNEAAFSIALVKFSSRPSSQSFLLVGVAKNLILNPRSCSSGFIYTYQVFNSGESLELMHKTPIEDVPGSICAFQGRILVGVGNLLRIYDLGKKKLLRKCENKQIPNFILQIQTMGPRIFVCDSQESCFFMRYKHEDNQIIIFADDTLPRFVTSFCILDFNTVAVGDKFVNLNVVC